MGGALLAERAVRRRCVDAARFKPQSQARAHEEFCPRAAVKSAIGEPVWARRAEIEPRVSAEDVDRHPAGIERVHDEAGAADQRLDLRGWPDVLRRLEQRIDLQAEHRRQAVRETHAAADLIGEIEAFVVFRECAEQPDLVAALVLCRESGGIQHQHSQYHRDLCHVSLRLSLSAAARRAGFAPGPPPWYWARPAAWDHSPSPPCGPVRRPCWPDTSAPHRRAPATSACWSPPIRCYRCGLRFRS